MSQRRAVLTGDGPAELNVHVAEGRENGQELGVGERREDHGAREESDGAARDHEVREGEPEAHEETCQRGAGIRDEPDDKGQRASIDERAEAREG